MTSYVVSSYGALNDLRHSWKRLAGPFENPLLDHDWHLSCAEAFYDDHQLRIVVVESKEGITAIAPMACVRKNGVEWLEVLGASTLGEPCGLLYDCDDSLLELVTVMLRMKRPVMLQRIRTDSPLAGVLRRAAVHRGLVVERRSADSRAIAIGSSWDEYHQSLSPQRRYDLRRARARAEAAGQVTEQILCPGPDELMKHLEEAFRIEASGWKGRRGSALATDKRLGKFFRLYAHRAAKEGILRICLLSVGGTAVAMQIGVEAAGRFWVLKIGYDESWSRCSPGMLLTMEAVRYAFSRGLRSYEFLGSDEAWLSAWRGEMREYSSLGLYPYDPRGMFSLGIDAGNYLARKMRRLTPGRAGLMAQH